MLRLEISCDNCDWSLYKLWTILGLTYSFPHAITQPSDRRKDGKGIHTNKRPKSTFIKFPSWPGPFYFPYHFLLKHRAHTEAEDYSSLVHVFPCSEWWFKSLKTLTYHSLHGRSHRIECEELKRKQWCFCFHLRKRRFEGTGGGAGAPRGNLLAATRSKDGSGIGKRESLRMVGSWKRQL